ncbi:MAG TPA: trypsin-like serine protease [Gemmatimonadaceae bacterium]|nr:trypsin-like serine protease [Gemmatimonadaceae bacterium]
MRRPSHFALCSAALALTVAGCADTATRLTSPTGASFIVNGQPTGSAYGNVGALLIDWDKNGKINGDDELCTGSLITPTVFLTAAHCVYPDPITPLGIQFYVSFSPDLYAKSMKYITATGYVWDPAYGHDQANLHDLALVFLPKNSTSGITPLQLPPAGYLDQLKASGAINSLTFVNVGYGTSSTQTGIPGFPYDGQRSYSYSEFMGLQPTWLGLLMNNSATGLGGDCYGDSGGPKFINGNSNMIVATVTTGDYNCRATTWDWRLDTPDARGFLGNYVKLP